MLSEFVEQFPQWQNPDIAVGKCKVASTLLMEHLPGSCLVHLRGYKGSTSRSCYALWKGQRWLPTSIWAHYVVCYQGFLIDLTARQFDRTADYPLILTWEETLQTWESFSFRV